jgi:hypothetical protein
MADNLDECYEVIVKLSKEGGQVSTWNGVKLSPLVYALGEGLFLFCREVSVRWLVDLSNREYCRSQITCKFTGCRSLKSFFIIWIVCMLSPDWSTLDVNDPVTAPPNFRKLFTSVWLSIHPVINKSWINVLILKWIFLSGRFGAAVKRNVSRCTFTRYSNIKTG